MHLFLLFIHFMYLRLMKKFCGGYYNYATERRSARCISSAALKKTVLLPNQILAAQHIKEVLLSYNSPQRTETKK